MGRVRGESLRPAGHDGDAVCHAGHCHRRGEKPRLLGDRFHEQCPPRRQSDRQRDPGVPAAAADVDEIVDPRPAQEWDRRQAVQDVLAGDPCHIADAAQVDRRVPGQEQADVVADCVELGIGERNREAGPDRRGVFRRKSVQVVNARRERIAIRRWGQLGTPVPHGRAAPGVLFAHPASLGLPALVQCPAGFPWPLASTVTHLTVRSSGADDGL